MKGKTHSSEEIIRILRRADGGETAQAVCREHNISEQIFYRWKKKYGEMELADAKQLAGATHPSAGGAQGKSPTSENPATRRVDRLAGPSDTSAPLRDLGFYL